MVLNFPFSLPINKQYKIELLLKGQSTDEISAFNTYIQNGLLHTYYLLGRVPCICLHRIKGTKDVWFVVVVDGSPFVGKPLPKATGETPNSRTGT